MSTTDQGPQLLLSVGQVAARLSLSNRAVLHRIAKGHITAVKVGDGRTSAYVVTLEEVERLEHERAA